MAEREGGKSRSPRAAPALYGCPGGVRSTPLRCALGCSVAPLVDLVLFSLHSLYLCKRCNSLPVDDSLSTFRGWTKFREGAVWVALALA